MSNITYTVCLRGLSDLDRDTCDYLSCLDLPRHRSETAAYALGYRLCRKYGLSRFDVLTVVGKGEDSYTQHTQIVYI